VTLSQALNGPTRCALSTLRAGGNRSGADAVLTSQTGFPLAVDFSRGYPRYEPYEATAHVRLARGEADVVCVLGAADQIPPAVSAALGTNRCIVIGPRASVSPLASAAVVIDTGIPGIHSAGTALRMDDVPLPLARALDGVDARTIASELLAKVTGHRAKVKG
jgi:formylmethanofuran dehydrogenase subunit B